MAVAAVPMLMVVFAPVLRDRIEARRAEIDKAEAARREPYDARLSTCGDSPLLLRGPGMKPGEIAIDVFPAFSPRYGLRLSEQTLRRYSGGEELLPLPPPPSAAGAAGSAGGVDHASRERPRVSPAIELDPRLGKPLASLLTAEIDQASDPRESGLDGVLYFFRYGDGRCATAWSPSPETRAGRIVELVNELSRLTEARGDAADRIQARIRQRVDALEHERQVVDGHRAPTT